MLSRVVPGSAEVIKRFSPSRRLINVDLPTFGRPMTATFGPSSVSAVGSASSPAGNCASAVAQQLVDTLPVRRRDANRRAQPKRVKLRLGDLAGHAFGLVHRDDDGLRLAPQPLGYRGILRREPAPVIDDEHDRVGFLDRELDLLGDERRDRRRYRSSSRPPVSMTMNLRVGRAADAVAAVAREPGKIRDERVARGASSD